MKSLSTVLALFLALAGSVAAQDQETSVFGETIDVRVVNVEAVVTDRAGNRVRDLKPGDFQLKVDGKVVPITFFTEVREGQATAAPSGEAPAAGPVEPGAEVGTSYLVFIDDFFPITIRRDEVLRSLKGQIAGLGPQDRMAVVAWDGGRLEMLSNWSGSPAQLGRAIDQALLRPAQGLLRAAERRSFHNDRAFSRQSVGDNTPLDLNARHFDTGLSAEERAYGTTLSLQIESAVSAAVSTMRAFAAPPGRKVMLLLSGGWPFSVQSFLRGAGNVPPSRDLSEGEALLRPLTSTANLLGYTIYPVDVAGIETLAADAELDSPAGWGSESEQEVEGTLEYIARQTGGKPIRNSNRTAALARAESDTRSYYWLGFTPTWERNDKNHRLELDVLRPGLRVRSRTGFLDLSKQAEVAMMLESALLFGNLPGTLSIPMEVGTPVRGRRGAVEVPIKLALPVEALTVVPVGDKYAARAELRLAASDKNGNSSEVPVIPLDLQSDEAPKPGGFVRYETKITLRGAADHLVVALYDPLSGRLATAESALKAP